MSRRQVDWSAVRRDRERTAACSATPSKKRYADRGQALRAAALVECDAKLYVYRCPSCRDWHMTKREQTA